MTNVKKKKKHRWLKKLIVWLIVLALAAGAVYLFVWPQLTAEATITYDQYTASRGTISNSLSFSGSVAVINSETLTASAAGTVRKVYVNEGDTVVSGDRLVRLSSGETLKANFDGTVNEIAVEEGDEVSANASVIQLVDFAHMKVTMRVDEYQISDVQVGQTCAIQVTALNESFDSTITHINKIAAGGGSTAYYTVSAELTVTEDVLPGMAVTVTIPQEEAENVIILNKSALSFDRSNSAYVYTMDAEGNMVETAVTTGVDNDNYVEITSGLNEGDVAYVENTASSTSSGGLSSLFSMISGGGSEAPTGGTMPSGGFDSSSFDRSNRGTGSGGGSFGGGMPSGGGMP